MSERELHRQAADIFRRAAAYIRCYGWQEEGMGQDGQPRCSMGALDSAHPQVAWDQRLAKLMYQTLNDELGNLSLTEYNHRVQTGEPVARLFESTANRLHLT